MITAITFLPPLVIVLFFPGMFVTALKYAGVYCIVLLILLPAWMAWAGRYKRKLTSHFTVPFGKPLLIVLMGLSCIMIGKALLG